MGLSRLTLLGFGILAWSGALALAALSFGSLSASRWGAIVAVVAATGGLATAVVGAARHDDY